MNKETTLEEVQAQMDALLHLMQACVDKEGNDEEMDLYGEQWLALMMAKKQILKERLNAN